MSFERVTYTGPTIDDAGLLAQLPSELSALLLEENGLVAYGGGFHIRGVAREPTWHSLRHAWLGADSIAIHYAEVQPADIPFAEDALGDQFLWREGLVHRLSSETGEVIALNVDLPEFVMSVQRAPGEYLSLEPLQAFEATGNRLLPGQLLSVYPPYCVSHESIRSMRAVSSGEHLRFLASFARQIGDLPDGSRLDIKIVE